MLGDLHCHTKLSDGTSTIDDLIFYAKRAGLDFLAVTDHDTVAGVTRAELLGKRYGVGVLSGVELTGYDTQRRRRANVLCYLPPKPDRLLSICARLLENRDKASRAMLEKVMTSFPVTADYVTRYAAGSRALYEAHIMHALMDLGYTDRIFGELYHKLLAEETGSCYVEMEWVDVRKLVDAVHTAGGLAVLSRPMRYGSVDLLEELAAQGKLDGVEVRAPGFTAESQAVVEGIADRYGLIKTGGTDFHGGYSREPNPIGSFSPQREQIDQLFRRAKHK